MNKNMYNKYSILSDFLHKAISLEFMGINEVCWKYEDVKYIVDYLYKNNCVILGGDILIKKNDEYLYTYDNWFVEKNSEDMSYIEYVEKSRNETIKYINEYVNDNGKNFYFVIVYKEY